MNITKTSTICIICGILLGTSSAYIVASMQDAKHLVGNQSSLASVGINRIGTVLTTDEEEGSLTIETTAADEPDDTYRLRIYPNAATTTRALYREIDESGISTSWGWLSIDTKLAELIGVPISVSFGYNGQSPLSPVITAIDYLPDIVPDSTPREPADGTKSRKTGTVTATDIDQGFFIIESSDEYAAGRVVRRYVHVSDKTVVLKSNVKETNGVIYEIGVEGGLSLSDISTGDPVLFAYVSKDGRVEATCIQLQPVIVPLNVNDDFCDDAR